MLFLWSLQGNKALSLGFCRLNGAANYIFSDFGLCMLIWDLECWDEFCMELCLNESSGRLICVCSSQCWDDFCMDLCLDESYGRLICVCSTYNWLILIKWSVNFLQLYLNIPLPMCMLEIAELTNTCTQGTILETNPHPIFIQYSHRVCVSACLFIKNKLKFT